MSVIDWVKSTSRKFKREIQVYRLALKDKRTPWIAKVFLSLAIGYLIMPFDLIPDFIPIIGQLDDLVIVPLLAFIALRFIPEEVIIDCRKKVGSQR